jgi:hypothetical protein
MKRLTLLLGVLISAAGFTRAAETSPAPAKIDAVAWLTGVWKLERNGRTTVEVWGVPAGGLMIGTSHTFTKERTMEYEFILIRPDANGVLNYVAKPSGQPEASFKLVRATDRELVFENPKHDFPQKISYVLKEDGTLLAAIDGTKNGKARRVEFPYRREK